ncbi:WD_REPEATS_REGION domain-containing protein, partial [Haematococcus lacustris]
DLTNALLAYSLRHAARVDRLLRSSFLLDYTLASMQVLSPEGELDQPNQ